MKIDFSKEWCLRMAQLEEQSACEFGVGAAPLINETPITDDAEMAHASDPNFGFGRLVRLMRRKKQLSVEKLAENAKVDISELVEIEEDPRYMADARTVFQLAEQFNIPSPKLMQLAGLSRPKDSRLFAEAIRFAARSEPVEELNDAERAALEAFVSVLSEQ
jgi:HTH-type transcriptional regulator, competence development regulator